MSHIAVIYKIFNGNNRSHPIPTWRSICAPKLDCLLDCEVFSIMTSVVKQFSIHFFFNSLETRDKQRTANVCVLVLFISIQLERQRTLFSHSTQAIVSDIKSFKCVHWLKRLDQQKPLCKIPSRASEHWHSVHYTPSHKVFSQ